jgi:hypothetical protein
MIINLQASQDIFLLKSNNKTKNLYSSYIYYIVTILLGAQACILSPRIEKAWATIFKMELQEIVEKETKDPEKTWKHYADKADYGEI